MGWILSMYWLANYPVRWMKAYRNDLYQVHNICPISGSCWMAQQVRLTIECPFILRFSQVYTIIDKKLYTSENNSILFMSTKPTIFHSIQFNLIKCCVIFQLTWHSSNACFLHFFILFKDKVFHGMKTIYKKVKDIPVWGDRILSKLIVCTTLDISMSHYISYELVTVTKSFWYCTMQNK